MHQICDGYNPRVRMGNWFEESYSVPQPSRTNPQKNIREAEIDIGYVDAHFKLRPLNRTGRMPQWNTNGLIEAPQFKENSYKSTAKQNYDVGVAGHFFKEWKPTLYGKNIGSITKQESSIKINNCKRDFKMFGEHNINQLMNQRAADTNSFKSSLVPNKPIQPEVLLQTIYQRDISGKAAGSVNRQPYMVAQTEVKKPEFRRIRSEITMRSIPLIKTNK